MVLCLPENLLFMETYIFIDNKNLCMYWGVSIYLEQADGFHLPTSAHLMCVAETESP